MPKASVATLWLMLLLLAACAAPPAPAPPPAPTPRTTAVTWREVEVVPSARGEHAWLAAPLQPMAQDVVDPQPWSYRVYLPKQDGEQGGASGERPLILLNLLASIEWDADDAYLNDFEEALREASFYLWDVTDGQMAIGQARIEDNRASWWDADIRVLARNTEAPHASIGGIKEQVNAAAYRVQVGPFWDSDPTANPFGKWSAIDGHRTLAHELGHYVLGLYDEYTLKNSSYTSCITAQPTADPHGNELASAMNWQYTTSELSARHVADLWDQGSGSCTGTLHWEKTKQSAWESVAARFNRPSVWQVLAPSASANFGPGRDDWPAALDGIPAITVTHVATGTSAAPLLSDLDLTVEVETPPAGVSVPGSFDEIWLSGPGRCAISLGKATVGVPLPLLGTHSGDTLFVKKHMGSFHWCGETEVPGNDSTRLALLVQAQRACAFVARMCSEDSPVANPSGAPFWLANLNPALAGADQATWRTQSGADWISPDQFIKIAQEERGLDPPDLMQWAADAVAALVAQGDNAPLITGIGLCLPDGGRCTRLPVSVVAYAGNEEQDTPAPLTFSSADGRLQVYGRGDAAINTLLILDSPPVAPPNGDLRSVSRVYTLAGDWEGCLQVQIQAECCVDANDENTPSLYHFADGEWSGLGRPPFSPQEGYVLATIDEPGSYALFR